MFEGIRKKLYAMKNGHWYCDNCGSYLNGQSGFRVESGKWECDVCGYQNNVSPENLNKGNALRLENDAVMKSLLVEFDGIISKSTFQSMANECAGRIRRLSIEVRGATIRGTVITVSGIDEWGFEVDYNDCGKVTGNYWFINYGNDDSSIPAAFAKSLKQTIQEEYKKHGITFEFPELHCIGCGAILNVQENFSEEYIYWKCKGCRTLNRLPDHRFG